MSSVLWWVTNGRAWAPPASTCSTGVSTSMKPRSCERAAEAGDHLVADLEGAAGVLVDDQVGVALAEAGVGVGQAVPLVGQRAHRLGRAARARSTLTRQLALAGGHHRAVRRRPSRRGRASSNAAKPSSPMTALETNSWISPLRSRIVAKISLPVSRMQHDPPGDVDAVLGLGAAARARPCARARSARVWRAVEAVRVRARRRASRRSSSLARRLAFSAARPLPVPQPGRRRPGVVGMRRSARSRATDRSRSRCGATPVRRRSFRCA